MIPLLRVPEGSIEGVEYTGHNTYEITDLLFTNLAWVKLDTTTRTLSSFGSSNRDPIEIRVGDWVVKDEGDVQVVRKEVFNKIYRRKEPPEGYKFLDPHDITTRGGMTISTNHVYPEEEKPKEKTWHQIVKEQEKNRDPLDEPSIECDMYLAPQALPKIKPAPMPMIDSMKEENKKRGYR